MKSKAEKMYIDERVGDYCCTIRTLTYRLADEVNSICRMKNRKNKDYEEYSKMVERVKETNILLTRQILALKEFIRSRT